MTEARIAAQLEVATDHVLALRRWATELAEVATWLEGRSVLDHRRALQRIERLVSEIGLSAEPIERVFGAPESAASEQTDRIVILTSGSEPCARCAGTGEVPIV